MANPYAGEVELTIDGQRHALKLTLGALAELEAEMEADSLISLVERFEGGRFSARDLTALLLAGLRGAGWPGDAEQLNRASIDGGPIKATQAAARLLAVAFAMPEEK